MPEPNQERATVETATDRTLTTRELNRALLARQLLLERVDLPLEDALDQIGGIQNQYAPSGYVALWTRLKRFRRGALTEALEKRTVIQATLMRTTIHLVSRREFWLYAAGIRKARREWALRVQGAPAGKDEAAFLRNAEQIRNALSDGPKTVKELGELAGGFLGSLGVWIDIARVPPSGTWERRRADRLALADDWVGPCDVSEDEGLRHLVRAYLRGFGPAPWNDIQSWAQVPVADLKRAGESLNLVRYRDEKGKELVDLPDAPLPDPDTPAPVRFLPHYDATLLVHARRTGILPEEHRGRVFHVKNPFSVGTCLVDGRVVGAWSFKDGRILLDQYESVPTGVAREIEKERSALEEFHR